MVIQVLEKMWDDEFQGNDGILWRLTMVISGWWYTYPSEKK